MKKRPDGYEQHTNDRSYRQNEHIRVAEEKLGRRLGKKEIVHHMDEDRDNNSPDNITVLRSKSDHSRLHSKIPVDVFLTPDGSHVVIKQQRCCPHCDRLFEPDNNRDVYCSVSCYAAAKIQRIPSAEELARKVWEKPTTAVAKEYNVSDVAVSKWCTKLGVDKPERGFWNMVNAGKLCLIPQK